MSGKKEEEACALEEGNMVHFVDHILHSFDRGLFDSSRTFLTCVFSESLMATVTIRLIRSFEHRNLKHVVYHDVDLTQSVADFKDFVRKDISTRPGLPPPFKTYSFDTLKISHKAYGYKSNDPVINLEDDEKLILNMLKEERSLKQNGVDNETEISFFKMEDYLEYKKNPRHAW